MRQMARTTEVEKVRDISRLTPGQTGNPHGRTLAAMERGGAARVTLDDMRDSRGTGTRGVDVETIRPDGSVGVTGARMRRPDAVTRQTLTTQCGSQTLTASARYTVALDSRAGRAWRQVARWEAVVAWRDTLRDVTMGGGTEQARIDLHCDAIDALTRVGSAGKLSSFAGSDALYRDRASAAWALAQHDARDRLQRAHARAMRVTRDADTRRADSETVRDRARTARTRHAAAAIDRAIESVMVGRDAHTVATLTRAARDVVRAWSIGRNQNSSPDAWHCPALDAMQAATTAAARGDRATAKSALARAARAVRDDGA